MCCKCLYLLASLKDSPGLGGAYEDKPQRCGRKPCSWVKYRGKRGQALVQYDGNGEVSEIGGQIEFTRL